MVPALQPLPPYWHPLLLQPGEVSRAQLNQPKTEAGSRGQLQRQDSLLTSSKGQGNPVFPVMWELRVYKEGRTEERKPKSHYPSTERDMLIRYHLRTLPLFLGTTSKD